MYQRYLYETFIEGCPLKNYTAHMFQALQPPLCVVVQNIVFHQWTHSQLYLFVRINAKKIGVGFIFFFFSEQI